jgi:hypothetical protein
MDIKMNAALAKLQTRDQAGSVRDHAAAETTEVARDTGTKDVTTKDTTARDKPLKFSSELMEKINSAGLADAGNVAKEPFVRIDPIFYKKNSAGTERINPENLSAAATLKDIAAKDGK